MTERRFWLPLLALVGLCRLSAGLELALIPPVGDERVAAAIRSAAAEVGIAVATLEPAQVIDPARFSAAVYGLAVLVGGERYPDTVIEEGDAAAALERYVEGGGALLVTGAGPVFSRPQRWSGSEWRTSPAPVRRIGLMTRLGLLDAGQPLETAPPAGSYFAVAPPSPLVGRLPEQLPLPAAGAYRPIPSNQDKGVDFTPLATLVDPQGGTYGAGLAQTLRPGELKGTVFYAWEPLLASPAGGDILRALLTLHANRTMSAEQTARRDELLAQLTGLGKVRQQAEAVLSPELKGEGVEALRKTMGEQAATLRWLREAAQAGNLNFVAMRLPKLREEIETLPARAGQAVDQAVIEAVVNPPGPRTVVPLEPPLPSAAAERELPRPAASDAVPAPAAPPQPAQPAEALAPGNEPRPETLPPPLVSAGTPREQAAQPQAGQVTAPAAEVSQPAGAAEPPSGERAAAPATTTAPAQPAQPEPAAPAQPAQPAQPEPAAPAQPAQPAQPEPAAPAQPAQPDPVAPKFQTANPVIELAIKDRGSIFIELLPKEAPKTASAFLYLVRSGFYDGTYFHRRVPRFVIQGGDPESRTRPPDDPVVGTGGPPWTVPGEFSATLTHQRGTVGLARAPRDPDSGGSQFYICLEAQPSLDREYAIFGQVLEGLEVVQAAQVGDRITAARVVQGAEATNPPNARPLELFGRGGA